MHRNCRGGDQGGETLLERCVVSAGLTIAVDPDEGIIHEWERTVGRDIVRRFVIKWYEDGVLFSVAALGKVPSPVSKALRILHFDDTIDKLLVRVALATQDRTVVSEDSDFWDPAITSRPGRIGDASAPVAALLRAELGITVLSVPDLMTALHLA